MFIVINCLGMPFDGNTVKNESLGGSESAAYYMAMELAKVGHKVTIFTSKAQNECEIDGVKYCYAGNPTQDNPCGEYFHFFAENTPHDVLIIQRNPLAFAKRFASKVNVWWLHDLATIAMREHCLGHVWNIDAVITVSDYHKNQVCELYGFDKSFVHVIHNGVNLSLYGGDQLNKIEVDPDKKNLLYSSRPERGLDHLVAANGIMERLGDDYHLYVCTYDNEPQAMQSYYNHLRGRCKDMPNVTLLGALTKQELAALQRQCTAHVYPTPSPFNPNFEEVSCITAMEAMAANIPFVSTKVGALPETCKGSGSFLIDTVDGFPNLDTFTSAVKKVCTKNHARLVELQQLAGKRVGWSASSLLNTLTMIFNHANKDSIDIERWKNSDIYAIAPRPASGNAINDALAMDLENCYDFAFGGDFKTHYEAYYEYEKQRGVDYGPESLDGDNRFEYVAGLISNLPGGCTVLDYGCAHGHYTVNLAKRFPDKFFIGVDIAYSNIVKATTWAREEDLTNTIFIHGSIDGDSITKPSGEVVALKAEAIIAAEILEHVADPHRYTEVLNQYLTDDGVMIITVPYGAWEAIGYAQHYPWRAHLWHFERGDLHYLWGDWPNFNVIVAPKGLDTDGKPVGSHIVTVGKCNNIPEVDYKTMFNLRVENPTQTVSVCMIVKDAEEDLLRCLNSVKDFATEIIIAVDPTSSDDTQGVIDRFRHKIQVPFPIVRVMTGLIPLDVGFDTARNYCIKEATCEWIFWIDHDEEIIHPERIHKYLRSNMVKGYAMRQHHMSAEPLGVMKTDIPARLFRNNEGITFEGRVHEHPHQEGHEAIEQAFIIPDIEIIHDGYSTNAVRQRRFMRNIALMKQDREDYPDRHLGKFLWMRDLAQMAAQEVQISKQVTPAIRAMAEEGVTLWEDLLEHNNIRLLSDSMEFYHILAEILEGKDYSFSVDASLLGQAANGNAKHYHGAFVKKEHVVTMFNKLLDDKTADFDCKYVR